MLLNVDMSRVNGAVGNEYNNNNKLGERDMEKTEARNQALFLASNRTWIGGKKVIFAPKWNNSNSKERDIIRAKECPKCGAKNVAFVFANTKMRLFMSICQKCNKHEVRDVHGNIIEDTCIDRAKKADPIENSPIDRAKKADPIENSPIDRAKKDEVQKKEVVVNWQCRVIIEGSNKRCKSKIANGEHPVCARHAKMLKKRALPIIKLDENGNPTNEAYYVGQVNFL